MNYTGKTGLLPQYGRFISRVSRIFPYHGKRFHTIQNYENWIFQPFSTIFPKYFQTVEEIQFRVRAVCHFIGASWLLLLMSLGAAYWMLETKASLFELSEVFQFEVF